MNLLIVYYLMGFLDTNYILASTTAAGDLIVTLTAEDVTTANVPDNKMYVSLTSPSPSPSVFLLPTLHYMIADHGYDDKNLYEYSKRL